jgi:hypothetical protein
VAKRWRIFEREWRIFGIFPKVSPCKKNMGKFPEKCKNAPPERDFPKNAPPVDKSLHIKNMA